MFKIQCNICLLEFFSSTPKAKYCSNKCRKEAQKTRIREYMRKRYNNDELFKERQKKYVHDWSKTHPEKKRETTKRWRKNHKGVKQSYSKPISIQVIEKLKEIANRQQYLTYIIMKKEGCEVCEKSKNETKLLLHHISYYPEEIITICPSCHGYLHHRLLKNNGKTKPLIN